MAYKRIRTNRRSDAEASVSLFKRRRWYADLAPTPASVIAVAGYKGRTVLAGATIVAGEAVYEDGVNGLKLALGDVVATADVAGVALNGGADGQPIEIIIDGDFDPGAVVVLGEVYMLSADGAGNIAPVGDIVATNSPTIIGVATTTSNIRLALTTSGILHA